MDAWGADEVIVETVGAGQGDVEAAWLADTVLLVLAPGAGDAIQALKAGIMEIPDVVALAKADRPDAAATARHVREALALDHARHPIAFVETDATSGTGVDELARLLDERRAQLARSGRLER
jgi:LAO/AO transport system kinase